MHPKMKARASMRRGIGRIAEVSTHTAKGLIHVFVSDKETRYALRFFVGDCKGFAPKPGDEVSFSYLSFRAREIRKLEKNGGKVVSVDFG